MHTLGCGRAPFKPSQLSRRTCRTELRVISCTEPHSAGRRDNEPLAAAEPLGKAPASENGKWRGRVQARSPRKFHDARDARGPG